MIGKRDTAEQWASGSTRDVEVTELRADLAKATDKDVLRHPASRKIAAKLDTALAAQAKAEQERDGFHRLLDAAGETNDKLRAEVGRLQAVVEEEQFEREGWRHNVRLSTELECARMSIRDLAAERDAMAAQLAEAHRLLCAILDYLGDGNSLAERAWIADARAAIDSRRALLGEEESK
jgi:hypothetical protein